MGQHPWVWLRPVYYVPNRKVPVPARNFYASPWKHLVTSPVIGDRQANHPTGVTVSAPVSSSTPDVSSGEYANYHQREGNSNLATRGLNNDDELYDSPMTKESSDKSDLNDGSFLDRLQLAVPYIVIFVAAITVVFISFCIHRKKFKERMSHRQHLRSINEDRVQHDLETRRNAITTPISQPRMEMMVPFRLDVAQLMVEIERQQCFRYNSSSADSCELGIMPPGYYSTLYRRSSIYAAYNPDKLEAIQKHKTKHEAGNTDKPNPARRGARVQFAKKAKPKPKSNIKIIDDIACYDTYQSTSSTTMQNKPDLTSRKSMKTAFTVFNALSKMKR